MHRERHASRSKLAPDIFQVSAERIRDELTKILTEGAARRGFELLDETKLLPEILPEIARMKGVEQPPQFHPEGDVWIHTLMMLEQLKAGCSPTLAWGVLLHDVGKPSTFTPPSGPDGRIRFDRHVEVGAKMEEDIAAACASPTTTQRRSSRSSPITCAFKRCRPNEALHLGALLFASIISEEH
jgi:poly(A) polymerase